MKHFQEKLGEIHQNYKNWGFLRELLKGNSSKNCHLQLPNFPSISLPPADFACGGTRHGLGERDFYVSGQLPFNLPKIIVFWDAFCHFKTWSTWWNADIFPTAVAEASDSQACSASSNPSRILENTGDLTISSVKKKQGVTNNNKKLTFSHIFCTLMLSIGISTSSSQGPGSRKRSRLGLVSEGVR